MVAESVRNTHRDFNLARISHKVAAREADVPESTALRFPYAKPSSFAKASADRTADKSDKVLDLL